MAATIFNFVAKSNDAGQTFYDFQKNKYEQLSEQLIGEETSIKMNSLPPGPIFNACVSNASSSPDVAAYARTFGKHSQYSSLKPRWVAVNLRSRDVFANFSVDADLILENIISQRGEKDSQCEFIVPISMGGHSVSYNMFPVARNTDDASGVVSNWSWWKHIEFVMKVWLLSQNGDAVIVYQVLLDYNDSDRPDKPTNFTYAVRFVAEGAKSRKLLTHFFDWIADNCQKQPANPATFYAYSTLKARQNSALRKMKRLTWERLLLEDKQKGNIVRHASSVNVAANLEEQIAAQWDRIRAVAVDEAQAIAGGTGHLEEVSTEEESDEDSTEDSASDDGAFKGQQSLPVKNQERRLSSETPPKSSKSVQNGSFPASTRSSSSSMSQSSSRPSNTRRLNSADGSNRTFGQPKPPKTALSGSISSLPDFGKYYGHRKSSIPSDPEKALVITGLKIVSGQPLQSEVEKFFKELLMLSIKVSGTFLLGKDKHNNGIICVEFFSVSDRDRVMAKNEHLRKIGSCVYFNAYKCQFRRWKHY